MPVAAIGKVGVPSLSSSYSAVDTFSDDRIGAVRQRTCQGCAFAWLTFFGVVPFLSYCSQSSLKVPKNQFLEKSDPLIEKLKNFVTKGFMWTMVYLFLPSESQQ